MAKLINHNVLNECTDFLEMIVELKGIYNCSLSLLGMVIQGLKRTIETFRQFVL